MTTTRDKLLSAIEEYRKDGCAQHGAVRLPAPKSYLQDELTVTFCVPHQLGTRLLVNGIEPHRKYTRDSYERLLLTPAQKSPEIENQKGER